MRTGFASPTVLHLVGDFKEEDHPRSDDGKFGSGSGGGSKKSKGSKSAEESKISAGEIVKKLASLPKSKIDLSSGKISDSDSRELENQKSLAEENLSERETVLLDKFSRSDAFTAMRQAQVNGFSGPEAADSKALHEAILREEANSAPVQLYRGMLLDAAQVDALMSSGELKLNATSSFSASASIASDFAGGTAGDAKDRDAARKSGDYSGVKLPVIISGQIKGMAIPGGQYEEERESLVSAKSLKIINHEVGDHPDLGKVLIVHVRDN
jgi:hypothetical protein